MNKSELISAISEQAGLSKSTTAKVLDAFTEAIQNELSQGGSVVISGFGSFNVRNRVERKGYNPQTGAAIRIKARKAPGFKAGKPFKIAVNR